MQTNTAPMPLAGRRVAGVDAARGGWVMAVAGAETGTPVEFSVHATFAEVCRQAVSCDLLALGVDMPIGLPNSERRRSDVEARQLLGARRSSLFWTPPLCVLHVQDYPEANQLSRRHTGHGLSKQTFYLLPRIREVREALETHDRSRVGEVHPETSFACLAGRPMQWPKRKHAGHSERLAVLSSVFPGIAEALSDNAVAGSAATPTAGGISLDDLLDAAAAAWTARRMAAGTARVLGARASTGKGAEGSLGETDETGYPMTVFV